MTDAHNTISKDKQYRTRDGHQVRIYSTDGEIRNPVHGAILTRWGWEHHCWGKDGTKWLEKTPEHFYDLIEVKPRIKRTVWLNIYPDHVKAWLSEHDAALSSKRIACVKVEIDCEEGDGL